LIEFLGFFSAKMTLEGPPCLQSCFNPQERKGQFQESHTAYPAHITDEIANIDNSGFSDQQNASTHKSGGDQTWLTSKSPCDGQFRSDRSIESLSFSDQPTPLQRWLRQSAEYEPWSIVSSAQMNTELPEFIDETLGEDNMGS
jgi:hypothetical protein